MSDNIENLLEFIEVSFDELAEADTPFFKQIRAVFRVCKAGKNILAGMRPDDAFEKFRDIMKHELKQLARSTHTGADLTDANLNGAVLDHATYSIKNETKTLFPEGFDPTVHNMVLKD